MNVNISVLTVLSFLTHLKIVEKGETPAGIALAEDPTAKRGG